MANPSYQTVTATGTTTPIVVDWLQVPFSLAWAVEFGAGATCTFNPQVTYDDPNDPTWTTTWLNVMTSSGSAQGSGGISSNTSPAGPIRAIRLNVTAITGTVRFCVLQGINQRAG